VGTPVPTETGCELQAEFEIAGGGFVRLDGSYADDLSVVNSARVSFGRKVDTMSDADIGLINYLLKNQHGTPFEHNMFRFHIKAPIFVAREWFRHRIGWSYNEFSARYAEMPDDFFVPEIEDFRTQVGMPGRYTFESLDEDTSVEASEIMNGAMRTSYSAYQLLIECGVAKELARSVLPVGMFTQFYATCNARSLMNFIELRADSHAQKEIRDYAEVLEKVLKIAMPHTHASFVSNGRKAP
jgi:thymidylate synthase (FAD)